MPPRAHGSSKHFSRVPYSPRSQRTSALSLNGSRRQRRSKNKRHDTQRTWNYLQKLILPEAHNTQCNNCNYSEILMTCLQERTDKFTTDSTHRKPTMLNNYHSEILTTRPQECTRLFVFSFSPLSLGRRSWRMYDTLYLS